MKRLVLALAVATMVVQSVPANAQRRVYYPPGGSLYHYDYYARTYYGGVVVSPWARAYVYDRPAYRYVNDPYYLGHYVSYPSGWWRGW